MIKIGEKISVTRENLQLTQEELAIRARKSLYTIQQLESNQLIPDLDTIFKISSVLDIPVADLLDGCKEENYLQ